MEVTQLWRYPVKSLAGERLAEAEVGPLGVDGDRQWGLVDRGTGLVLTARRVPELLFAVPVPRGGAMAVRLPDGTETDDDEVLSRWLGRPVELRRPAADERGRYEIAENDDRPEGGWTEWEGPAGVWHDSTRTRLSIVAAEALEDHDVRRFRPNIVIRGGDERVLVGTVVRIGDVVLDVVKEIDRCVVVTRPQPGIERDKSVLVQVHRERDGNLGVGALVVAGGTIREGDPVEPA